MIIAIDFDGTICRNKYPEIGDPMPLAIWSIKKLKERGHDLILWTCRQGEQLEEAVRWCEEHGIPFDLVNEFEPNNLKAFGGVAGNKVFANIYIDDRNLGGFPGWKRAMELIKEAEIPKLKWTRSKNIFHPHNIGYSQISDSTQMVYCCLLHDFGCGLGPCWTCLQEELPLEIDPRTVAAHDLYEWQTERPDPDHMEDAILICEENFKSIFRNRRR